MPACRQLRIPIIRRKGRDMILEKTKHDSPGWAKRNPGRRDEGVGIRQAPGGIRPSPKRSLARNPRRKANEQATPASKDQPDSMTVPKQEKTRRGTSISVASSGKWYGGRKEGRFQ